MKKDEWLITIKMNRLHVLKIEVKTRGGMKVEVVNIPVPHGQLFTIPVQTAEGTKCINLNIGVS